MSRKQHTPLYVVALALALGLTALAPAIAAQERQTDPPRRPQGPAAGPVIKLPRGAGGEQSPQAATQKEGAAQPATSAPMKWEYCAITGFATHEKGLNGHSYWAVIRYFPNTTEEVEGADTDDALANAFAKLGDDGWELAGIRTETHLTEGSGRSQTDYFFKRPKGQ
jgi:hypothetical protein